MELYKLASYTRGWFVGDFDPTLYKTTDVEVGVKRYNKGDKEDYHVHKVGEEITVVVSGKVKMDHLIFEEGDMVKIRPNFGTDFEALEDNTVLVVVKYPSVPGDKYVIKSN